MNFTETKLKGSYIIETIPLKDSRGYFERMFCEEMFQKVGLKKRIVQINHSLTLKKGTVRGLHFQKPPYAEIKIIKCIKGSVFDIIVDIRKDSKTFLKWTSVELKPENNKMIFIPEGFAHGFQTLEENAELLYFHTEFYEKEAEGGLSILDKKIDIQLPLPISEQSQKDKSHKFIESNFKGLIF